MFLLANKDFGLKRIESSSLPAPALLKLLYVQRNAFANCDLATQTCLSSLRRHLESSISNGLIKTSEMTINRRNPPTFVRERRTCRWWCI